MTYTKPHYKINHMGGAFYGQAVNMRAQSKIKSNGVSWLSNETRMNFVCLLGLRDRLTTE